SAPDLSQVASVSGVGGTLHAVAAGWRATFADDGSVDFEPARGRSAARAASWRMRLGAVRRGGEALLDTAGAAPRTSHDRKQATHHWRGADERFVATPAGSSTAAASSGIREGRIGGHRGGRPPNPTSRAAARSARRRAPAPCRRWRRR
ncbi:MAG: hypothetical protein ACK6D1_04420, partial [Planctomycetota bacterium]